MLIERVLADLDVPDPEAARGNPIRGSWLGRCARQSAYMLWPEAFPPEPLSARAKLVFRFGDMIHEMVRRELRRVCPGEWGYEEGRFHFKVSLSHKEARAAHEKMRGFGLSWGDILRRPLGASRLSGRVTTCPPRPRDPLTLDLAEPAIYVPTHVDGIADLPGLGLASCEIKSMATGSFRKALQGHVDYAYRVQMACAAEAAGLDTELYLTMRKDTCHVLEVVYSRKVDAVSIEFTKHSGLVERVRQALNVATSAERTSNPEYETSVDWEAAEVRHPFEPGLLEQARARVRRILVATPAALPEREYGPDFFCSKCDGMGFRHCAACAGTGQTPSRKRAHKPCAGTGVFACSACDGRGRYEEVDLPWQCSYCPFVRHCWEPARMRLELDERPHWIVKRQDYEASGIAFSNPEAMA